MHIPKPLLKLIYIESLELGSSIVHFKLSCSLCVDLGQVKLCASVFSSVKWE